MCVVGVLIMRTEFLCLLFKNIVLFLSVISISLLSGCSFQYSSIFAVKPSSPERPIESQSHDDNRQQSAEIPNMKDSNIIDNSNDKKGNHDSIDTGIDSQLGDNIDTDKEINNKTEIHIDNELNKDANMDEDREDQVDKAIDRDIHNNMDSNDESSIEDEANQANDSSELDKAQVMPAAKIIRNSSNKELKRVAITFDDGPDGDFTPQILDILKEYDTKATFFVLGSIAAKNRDVLKRIDQEGHVIGNHSWNHSYFTKISESKIIEELRKTDDLIQEVIGKSNSLFRLPYGAFNNKVLEIVAQQGYHNIYWSIDPRDWSGKSPKQILNNIQANIEPGAIILLHSSGPKKSIPNTIKALPHIIEFLQEQGYEIVTIPELLEDCLLVDKSID